jgi:ribosomal protein L20A (L18A)
MKGRSLGSMKAYRVTGTAPFGSQRQEFSYDFAAEDADQATAKTYSIIGSRHRAKRRTITIADVSEIDPRTSTEPQILHAFREQIAAAGGLITEVKEEE